MKKIITVFILIGLIFVLNGCKNDTVKVNGHSYKVIKKEGWVSIDKDVFVSTGGYLDVTMTLVVDGDEATIIDTGNEKPELNRAKDYIKDHKLTVKNIIITHEHADHTNNLNWLKSSDTTVYTFNDTTDQQEIKMGDHTFKIIRTPGHYSDRHMSILINDEILIAGDILVTPKTISPNDILNYGGNRETAISTLEELNKTDYSFIIPGHGKLAVGNKLIDENLEILKAE